MTFTIQKKYVLSLGNWLNSLALNGKQSRARTRFVALLQESLERLDKDRKQILEEYAKKDKDGKPEIIEKDGQQNYDIPDADKDAFNVEIAALYDEDAELGGPETGPVFVIVKDIVLNYDKEIDPSIAGAYDKWCEAFEKFPKVQGLED